MEDTWSWAIQSDSFKSFTKNENVSRKLSKNKPRLKRKSRNNYKRRRRKNKSNKNLKKTKKLNNKGNASRDNENKNNSSKNKKTNKNLKPAIKMTLLKKLQHHQYWTTLLGSFLILIVHSMSMIRQISSWGVGTKISRQFKTYLAIRLPKVNTKRIRKCYLKINTRMNLRSFPLDSNQKCKLQSRRNKYVQSVISPSNKDFTLLEAIKINVITPDNGFATNTWQKSVLPFLGKPYNLLIFEATQ